VARDVFNLVGTTIAGKYRVDRVVGEGGLGVVYAGMHLVLNAPVAIKCLKPLGGTLEDEQRLTRSFLREATVLFSLTHPGIVRLFDVGELTHPVPVPYVVLELIDGSTLEDELRRRSQMNQPYAWPEIFSIFEPVLEAVAFAHQQGVTHRDLKPSNVMLVQKAGAMSAKVVDFGIARRVGDQRHTAATTGFTPRYAAPEQWDGTIGPTSTASDVFSLGLMLAEMCTLEPVFSQNGPAEIFGQVMDPTRRISVTQRRRDLSVEVDRIIERATRLAPQERYRDARDLLVALRALGSAPAPSVPRAVITPAVPPVVPVPAAVTPPPEKQGTSATLILTLAVVLVAVAGLSVVVVWLLMERSDSKAPKQASKDPQASNVEEQSESASTKKSKAKNKEGAFVTLETILGGGDGLTQGQINKALDAHIEDVKGCYQKAIERDPKTPGGKITLMLSIGESGKVDSTMCAEEGIEDKAFRLCLTSASSEWKFPKPTKDWGIASFMATYRFKRSR